MTRELRRVDASDALDRTASRVAEALREALAGGDAVFPDAGSAEAGGPAGRSEAGLPDRVPQRVALVVETSGTSGAPKRVALSADALLASAAGSESALGGPAQWVLALPVHYIAGLNVLIRSIAAGTDPVPVRGEHFTADGFVDACARLERPRPGGPERAVALVPAQLRTLLDDPTARRELVRFAAVLVGGQATPAPLAEEALGAGVRVVRSYGSSETSGGCVYDGAPLSGVQVRVDGGEVRLGGTVIAEGYLRADGTAGLDEERTADRFSPEGGLRFFRTADAGEWDGERLRVLGRLDDVIVSGGVKVALGAVERVLREQPGFEQAVVVAGPDARWGETPVAFVARAAAGAGAEGRAIASADSAAGAARAAVADRLGAAARPRVLRVDRIPTLPSGKPDRAALRGLATRESAPREVAPGDRVEGGSGSA